MSAAAQDHQRLRCGATRQLLRRSGAMRHLAIAVTVLSSAALLASCASTPDVALARRPGVPTAPSWQGTGAVDATASTAPGELPATWVVAPYPGSTGTGPGGNARPDWIVYQLSGTHASQVTPPGVVVRGGVAVSALSSQVAWLGMGSYRFDLDGNVALTTDGGRRWSQNVLPFPYRPAPGGILATSPHSAVVLAGTGSTQELVQSTNGGVNWQVLASAGTLLGPWARTCTLEGLGESTGATLVVGSQCHSGTGVIVVRTAAGAIERFTVDAPDAATAQASVTSVPQAANLAPDSTASSSAASSSGSTAAAAPGAMVDITWRAQHGGGQLAGVVSVPETFGAPAASSAEALGLDGAPATVLAPYSVVSIAASGAGGPQALLLAVDPTRWSHLGPVQLLLRRAPSDPWAPVTMEDRGGRPDALAWSATSASGSGGTSGGGLGTLVVTGSTARGDPASWTVALTAPAAGPVQGSWEAVPLAVPQVPTAKSLS